ncbi:hypothetical protein C8A03DRAFT_45416 [Achaetomium macrosporum]|uniref:Uncharacterized protein n=1 Tax=Achaetomium macrosporum TaxID=79813 RepID=A0AAN7C719_9PEZI|nr:hypothetical protein C8A03DRAFT_45416 [Achaetomium macrosporum]
MAVPANAAVRENRRRSTPLDLERINVIKALTAAEYSRRQFILNFAASRDTKLLVPGRKSDAIKAAEEWVAAWLSQSGYETSDHEFFKYSVDARLWSIHVGGDIEFPFAFMRGNIEAAPSESSNEAELKNHGSEAFLLKEIDLRDGEITPPAVQSPRGSWRKQQQRKPPLSTLQNDTQHPTKHYEPAEIPSRKKRSLSSTSLEDPKASPGKSPFLVRLGRSWSRRLSSSS